MDIASAKEVFRSPEFKGPIIGMSFTSDGGRLLYSDGLATVSWRSRASVRRSRNGMASRPDRLAFFPDGKRPCSGNYGALQSTIWRAISLAGGWKVTREGVHHHVHPDGKRAISGGGWFKSEDGKTCLRLHRPAMGSRYRGGVGTFRGHEDLVLTVAISPTVSGPCLPARIRRPVCWTFQNCAAGR